MSGHRFLSQPLIALGLDIRATSLVICQRAGPRTFVVTAALSFGDPLVT